jgi:D-serine deaminase-like pyridoxal phosphate-dependent protein
MPLNWSNRMLGETGALDLVKKIVSHQPTPPEWLVVDYGWAATVRDRAGYRGCADYVGRSHGRGIPQI